MDWPHGAAVAAPDLAVRRRLVLRRPTSRSPDASDLPSDAKELVRAPRDRTARPAAALALSIGLHVLAGLAFVGWVGSARTPEPEPIRVVLLPTPATPPVLAAPAQAPVARPTPERPRRKRRDPTPLRAAQPPASVVQAPPEAPPTPSPSLAPGGADAPVAAAAGPRSAVAPLAAFRLARQVAPVYPRSARAAGSEGTSLLRVHVTRSGRVDGIRIERSAGDAALDRAAEAAVRRWRFAAPVPSEDPAGVWVLAPIEFRLR